MAWRRRCRLGLDLPAVEAPQTETTAVELLAGTLGPTTTLHTLGPLTNVAEAFREEPGLTDRVGQVVVMGGAVDVPGNVELESEPAVAEWNLYVDPVAAAEVLTSAAPVVLVGLDATDGAPVTPSFVEELADASDTPEGDLMVTLFRSNGLVASGDAYFWDPLAAAVVIDPELVRTERVRLEVLTTGDEAGRTLPRARGIRADVAMETDADGLERMLLSVARG